MIILEDRGANEDQIKSFIVSWLNSLPPDNKLKGELAKHNLITEDPSKMLTLKNIKRQ